jgi:Na+/phosphate symporter
MAAWIPILILVIGLVLYFIASNPKVTEVGKIMFFCGLFVTTWQLAGRTVRVLFGG